MKATLFAALFHVLLWVEKYGASLKRRTAFVITEMASEFHERVFVITEMAFVITEMALVISEMVFVFNEYMV